VEILLADSPKPRVLVVTYPYYPVVGGLPRQAHLLNRTFRKHGFPTSVVTPRIEGYPDLEILDEVPVQRLWTLRNRSTGYRLRFYPWLISLASYLIFCRRDYDVIQVHQALHHAAVCVIIGKILRKPMIIRVTGSGDSGNIAILKQGWLGSVVLRIIRHADCFVSLSNDISNELMAEGIFRDRITRINNGIDTSHYSPAPLQANTSDYRMVLCVGRFSEEKGFDILVRAWPKVIEQIPNSRLVVVGDGPDLPLLKNLTQDLRIEETVSFEGMQNNVIDYFSKADVFVLPSRNEGMSNALLEAMSMERACVVSDIPANCEVLSSGVEGLVFRKDDPDDLAAQVIQLLKNPQIGKELGINARRRIMSQYSIDRIAKRYEDLFLQIFSDYNLNTK
jgi:glycosyltransferase involved in cell wall biosynthesis